jgi:hypothetical protein
MSSFNAANRIFIRIVLIVFLFFPMIAISQTGSSIHPKVIPPSPDAQSFVKYGEIPVSHATGTPNIEISIYEINSKKLKLPISLNYHPNIKPSDIASCVGLGWKLNAGGLMTRSIKGKADEAPSGGMLNVGIITLEDVDNGQTSSDLWYRAKYQSEGSYDNSSDNYYYSVGNGLSGGFVYDKNKNLVKMSYSDDKILRTSGNTFEITDDKGTFYQFDHKENTLENSAYWVPGSWWLTKIISSDRTDTISFEYENYPYTYGDVYASQSLITRECFNGYTGPLNTYASIATSYMSLLKKITFKDGFINFSYLNDRLDLRASRLKEISIYTNQNTLLKKTVLNHGHFYSGYANNVYNYRLKLTGLTTKNGNDGVEYSHSFEYNEQDILPPYRSPTDNNTLFALNALDYWGYYNGKVQNPNLIPITPYTHLPAGDRTPDERYAKACILEKIVYPTGGFTTFTYEGNRQGGSLGYPGTGSITGGLRISQITTKASPEASPVIKKYEYGNGVSLMPFENLGRYSYTERYQDCESHCFGESTTYLSDAIVPLADFNGSPVIYTAVDEYVMGDNNQNLKTSYLYDTEPDQIETIDYPRYPSEYAIKRNWARGNLLVTAYYSFRNGSYMPVRSFANSYISLATKRIITGSKFCDRQISANCTIAYIQGNPVKNSYFYFDEKVDVGIKKLESTTIIDYDSQGNHLAKVDNFVYGSSLHLNVTKKNTIKSDGQAIETTIKYPFDFAGIPPYSDMISRNIVAVPVEETTVNVNLNQQLSNTKTNYSFFQSNQLIEPSSVFISFGGATAQNERQFTNYDKYGNILEIVSRTGPKTCYVWAYKGQYPIAEIVNADFFAIVSVLGGTLALENFGKLPNPDKTAIDNFLSPLRNNLPDAQVTTYTYEPMVGMTSQTDAKGMTVYYEYDAFQRLKLIRDQNNNIIKTYCYNYAGQVTDCNAGGGTSPAAPLQIYARIEVLNPSWSAPTDGSTTEADIYLALYGDAACTQPVSRSQAFDVNVSTTGAYFYNNSSSVSSWTNTYSVPASTNRILLGRYATDSWYSYNDPYYGQIVNSETYTYQVEDNGANVYIPSPTY